MTESGWWSRLRLWAVLVGLWWKEVTRCGQLECHYGRGVLSVDILFTAEELLHWWRSRFQGMQGPASGAGRKAGAGCRASSARAC